MGLWFTPRGGGGGRRTLISGHKERILVPLHSGLRAARWVALGLMTIFTLRK